MLGAQALRTKQRAEQKEKEKRHRERQKSLEIQRDKLHKAACEEAAAKLIEISAQPPLKSIHRHSVHAGAVNHLHISTDDFEKLKHQNGSKNQGPQRSTSSDQCRLPDKKHSISQSNPNKFLKWLGLAGKEGEKMDFNDKKKRRMSTFT